MARGSPNPAAQALARAVSGQRRHLPEAKVREEVARYGEEVLAILRSEVVRGFRTISDSVATAKAGIAGWFSFDNDERLHQALGYRPPAAILRAARLPVDMPLRLDNADALPTYPQARPQPEIDLRG